MAGNMLCQFSPVEIEVAVNILSWQKASRRAAAQAEIFFSINASQPAAG